MNKIMGEKNYIAYLHSCGISQGELREIFSGGEILPEEFYVSLSEKNLQKYIKNTSRRAKILERYGTLDTDRINNILKKNNVSLIILGESDYPESLTHISHTPYILYVRGKIPTKKMFGVVGSRKITSYGKQVISRIIPDISKIFCIVSGGAAGCDSEAHKTTIHCGGITVVVIGTGIDQTYPAGNAKLFDEVVEKGGAIISIFPIGEPGNPYNFPVRNEIVVGLCEGILIVEAQEKSGSHITAKLCLDMGKDLFSVPGEILKYSSIGTNSLIKNGEAKCVTESTDILEEYDIHMKRLSHENIVGSLTEKELLVYEIILGDSLDIEGLTKKLDFSVTEIMEQLSLLELKGMIKKEISGKYILR